MKAFGLKTKAVVMAMLLMGVLGAALPAVAAKLVPKVDNFILFLDHSSSMKFFYKGVRIFDLGGQSKIVLGKSAMVEFNKLVPPLGYKSGVYTFAPYERFLAMAPYNREAMERGIAPISIDYETYGRMTPMGIGLQELDKQVLSQLSGRTAVVLFTDGDSNLGVDPVMVAKQLQAKYGDRLCFMVVSLADNEHGAMVNKQIAALSQCNCFVTIEDFLRNQAAREAFVRCGLYEEMAGMEETVVFRSIYFDFDKYNIKPEFAPVLDEGVNIIQSKPELKVVLEGHTDSVGTEKYNMALSIRRANSVKAYMTRKGVNPSRVTTVGYGKDRPRYDNSTAEGRKLNRRVEIKFEPMK